MSVAVAFGGVMPDHWGIDIENQSGGTLDATGSNHAALYQGIKAEVIKCCLSARRFLRFAALVRVNWNHPLAHGLITCQTFNRAGGIVGTANQALTLDATGIANYKPVAGTSGPGTGYLWARDSGMGGTNDYLTRGNWVLPTKNVTILLIKGKKERFNAPPRP